MINRKIFLQVVIFLFLVLHLIPFIAREIYQDITIINYSVIGALAIVISFTSRKLTRIGRIYCLLVICSLVIAISGGSGSIFSLVLAATLPSLLFVNIKSQNDFQNLFERPAILVAILGILLSLPLYLDLRGDLDNYSLLGDYFGIASINYVPLTLFSVCILLYLVALRKVTGSRNRRLVLILFTVLVSVNIFFSTIFLTRSILAASSFSIFLVTKRYRYLLFLVVALLTYPATSAIIAKAEKFFGGSSLIEITLDYQRYDSVTYLIRAAFNFDFNFRENMSYSSLANLLFSIFPFTLIFLYLPVKSAMALYKEKNFSVLSVLLCSFFTICYQMDFLSIFSFFLIVSYAGKFPKTKSYGI